MKRPNCNGTIRNDVTISDFRTVFNVFSFGPFFEKWTPEQVLETYESFNVKDGNIFGYYINGKCVGIISICPHVPGKYPVNYPDNSKVMYLSDIATLPEYRGNGIGTSLLEFVLRHLKVLGYEYIYLRTNEKGDSMLYKLAEKCGFTQIPEVCQEVYFPRTSPYVPETDLRIFMERKI